MTTVRDAQSLSRLDIVVLARLSSAKVPGEAKLGSDIAKLGDAKDAEARAREVNTVVLPSLRRRGLVNERRLTEAGNRALRVALQLDRTPTWTEVAASHLPALALELKPGSTDALTTLKSGKSILVHVVTRELGLAKADTLDSVCDALIRQAFEIPDGPLDLRRIRAYALAHKSATKMTREKESAGEVAKAIGRAMFAGLPTTKPALTRELGRRWLYHVTTPSLPTSSATPRAADAAPELTIVPPPQPPTPIMISPETLLNLVRETIPQIGSDGRFGKEKVFVSAIWQRIERDKRVSDFSLDRFKRWLVTANREQLLDLARADLVGAMDPRLVRESEIEDLGATFHFVVDRRASASGQGHHAR